MKQFLFDLDYSATSCLPKSLGKPHWQNKMRLLYFLAADLLHAPPKYITLNYKFNHISHVQPCTITIFIVVIQCGE